ncbi:NnrU family protein [Rhodanobacter sp. FW510-R12]|uniref:NnrU family protein n=1 Tax=unclassified Rhodanobacter TaxID=2621553 RepID=UPI0007AA1750|nr:MULTISPECIES: NnrU family protein [unclassified Rhodanobacter]KZC17412.1 NnrU family protein [Rhodanobacter sp. FW104-R8]KZC27898.1 NnrU family protein [Rhodanobacter sp. FW510-T8]KZC32085.1 NnrU family protein [Rhodanobacter sp. FW510-R10]
MPVLILGLVLFLGVHSLRIFADGWRNRQRARLGELRWKGLYALVSLIGFALICWGFGLARQHAVLLYVPPLALRHANALFTLIAFVLVAAAYVPHNHLKAAFGHPMLLGVKVWAFGHLLATGMLHDVLLFGAFLQWAVVLFIVSRRRDRLAGTVYPAGRLQGDMLAVAIGVAAWAAFALWLHLWLIGVNPMP